MKFINVSFDVVLEGNMGEKEGKTINAKLREIIRTNTNINYGCALKGNLIELIKRRLFEGNKYNDCAKLYAICIYLLVQNIKKDIRTLIICNDEDFSIVKRVLNYFLKNYDFEIININKFRRGLGRNIGSLADNYARIYRRRALKANRQIKGKRLNIIEVNFNIIRKHWEELKENKV